MKILILAGGSGTRLWPLSRQSYPKQFLHFGETHSLLQKTILRFFPAHPISDFLILTHVEYRHLVEAELSLLHPDFLGQVVAEPVRKNTAPAIALGCKILAERQQLAAGEPILVCSSDHLLSPLEEFLKSLQQALPYAVSGQLVVFGIRPTRPETGYGYIQPQRQGCAPVKHFIEKPDYETACRYVREGSYLWNAGIFLFTAETFWEEIAVHCPILHPLSVRPSSEIVAEFALLPSLSIDYALMEKTERAYVMPLNILWSDIGSWDSVYEMGEKDQNRNVKTGNVHTVDTTDSLIFGTKRLISTIGLEDMLVVDTEDALFVAKKGHSQFVKELVATLKGQGAKEVEENHEVKRPWGSYTVLGEGERYKIKKICVDPKSGLSLQFHVHRSEHWVVVRGVARTIVEGKEQLISENGSVYVPKGALHRLENPGLVPLEIIEVQSGEYIGEDDIVRVEDVYSNNLKSWPREGFKAPKIDDCK